MSYLSPDFWIYDTIWAFKWLVGSAKYVVHINLSIDVL